MSLKQQLTNRISEKGSITYDEMVAICRAENKKISNGERRLRKSESPFVEAIYSEDGKYIKAYQWKPPVKSEQGQYVLPLN